MSDHFERGVVVGKNAVGDTCFVASSHDFLLLYARINGPWEIGDCLEFIAVSLVQPMQKLSVDRKIVEARKCRKFLSFEKEPNKNSCLLRCNIRDIEETAVRGLGNRVKVLQTDFLENVYDNEEAIHFLNMPKEDVLGMDVICKRTILIPGSKSEVWVVVKIVPSEPYCNFSVRNDTQLPGNNSDSRRGEGREFGNGKEKCYIPRVDRPEPWYRRNDRWGTRRNDHDQRQDESASISSRNSGRRPEENDYRGRSDHDQRQDESASISSRNSGRRPEENDYRGRNDHDQRQDESASISSRNSGRRPEENDYRGRNDYDGRGGTSENSRGSERSFRNYENDSARYEHHCENSPSVASDSRRNGGDRPPITTYDDDELEMEKLRKKIERMRSKELLIPDEFVERLTKLEKEKKKRMKALDEAAKNDDTRSDTSSNVRRMRDRMDYEFMEAKMSKLRTVVALMNDAMSSQNVRQAIRNYNPILADELEIRLRDIE